MYHLPDEIILFLVDLVAPIAIDTEDLEGYRLAQKTLGSLCLVSKRLCAIAQPFLYRTFVKPRTISGQEKHVKELKGVRRQDDHDKNDVFRRNTVLENFLRTLIQRPDLAATVEHLRVERFYDDESVSKYRQDLENTPFDSVLARNFHSALQKAPGYDMFSESEAEWDKNILEGTEGTELALLFTLVPNVRSLDIESIHDDLGTFVQELCVVLLEPLVNSHGWDTWRRRLGPPPIFAHLESLVVRSSNPKLEKVMLPRCKSLLTLPTLVSFTGYGLGENDEKVFQPSIGHLRHLKLDRCAIFCANIHTLVKSCKELQSLEIVFRHCSNSYMHRRELEFEDTFLEHLQKTMTGSLERLVLVAPEGWSEMSSPSEFNVRALSKLRFIELDNAFVSLVPNFSVIGCPLVLRASGLGNVIETLYRTSRQSSSQPKSSPVLRSWGLGSIQTLVTGRKLRMNQMSVHGRSLLKMRRYG